MLFNFQKKLILILVYCTCCICTEVGAQSPIRAQSFALADLLDAAALTYPSLVAARIEARAANEDLSATERIRWPTVSATVESYSGNLRSYPSRAVQVDQTLWDGGRNSARISESEVLANISLLKVYMQQQDLFLQMVAAWQSMISSRERVKVAQLTLARLEDYQKKMLRRVEAEASPRIDLELVDARLLQTQVELTASLSSLQVAVMRLEQFSGEVGLLGRISGAVYPLTLIETQSIANQLSHTDWKNVANEHPASAKARLEVLQMRRRLDAKQAEAYPQVFVRVYKPVGTIPSSTDTTTTTFLGMRYTPGAGFSNLLEAQAIATRITGSEQAVDAVIREIQQNLQNDHEELINARSRIAALEKSVASSDQVLESYQRLFQAGRKQWHDLLNQVRELAQNQYALADAQAAMVGAMYRVQIRMHQNIQ